MQTVKFTLLALLCSCLLGACGLKGPLYLAEDVAEAGSAENADDAEEKEDEQEASGKS